MKIKVKIGTHSASVVHVCRKRKLPVVGEWINIKQTNDRYYPEERVRVCEIKELPHETIFYLSR